MSPVRLGLSPEIEGKLHRAVSCIAEIASPQLVILFGPYAEGCAQEGSDLDLLVVAETVSRVHLAVEIAEAIRPILAPLEFDILIRTPQRWELGRRTPGFVSRDADCKSEEALARARLWMEYVVRDMRAIRLLQGQSLMEAAVCFHAQHLQRRLPRLLGIADRAHLPDVSR